VTRRGRLTPAGSTSGASSPFRAAPDEPLLTRRERELERSREQRSAIRSVDRVERLLCAYGTARHRFKDYCQISDLAVGEVSYRLSDEQLLVRKMVLLRTP
jgi:hypothetical protein